MKLKYSLLLAAALLIGQWNVATSQSDEAPPEEEEVSDPLADIFGEEGMDLTADGFQAETDSETGEMTKMHVWGKVKLISELMDLDCEDLVIDMENQTLIATGAPVKFDKKDVGGECGKLHYDIEKKITSLTGRPKPTVRQGQVEGGAVQQTSAKTITIVEKENKSSITCDGDAEFKVLPAQKKKTDGGGEPQKPNRVDKKSRAPKTDN